MDTTTYDTKEMIWIYTGVVTFLPTAAKYLRSISPVCLRACTKGLLESIHLQEMER